MKRVKNDLMATAFAYNFSIPFCYSKSVLSVLCLLVDTARRAVFESPKNNTLVHFSFVKTTNIRTVPKSPSRVLYLNA